LKLVDGLLLEDFVGGFGPDEGQMGRDAGHAGLRDPRHVRAMSADLDKAQAEAVELSTAATASNQ
jgi:hypothetical protein